MKRKDDDFVKAIKVGMYEHGYTYQTLAKAIMMPAATFYRKLKNPESMTVKELRAICNTIKMPDEKKCIII